MIFFIVTIYGCSTHSYINNKTNNLVEKLHSKSDTIFSFSSNEITMLWCYKNDELHSYLISPFKVKRYDVIKAKNMTLNKNDLLKYFDKSLDKSVECFENDFDGSFIKVYIKNQETLYSGINRNCLFKNKYTEFSLPYKLQYDFSMILKPENYNFNDMYNK